MLDMEAAAIAEIAEISRVNMLAVKSISDFVDVDDIVEQLTKNRELAISNVAIKLDQLITRLL